jgi:hypothetical protein
MGGRPREETGITVLKLRDKANKGYKGITCLNVIEA